MLDDFAKKLGVKFNNLELLQQALTHRSYLNEHRSYKLDHNERLEFLGDAVLELVVTEFLYKTYPNPEGELTNWRASLVNAKMLAELAQEIELDKYLYLSKGETKDLGKARLFILANAFEALIGSIYLDQGFDKTRTFLKKFLLTKLPYILEHQLYLDPKSKFQEFTQEKFSITPVYKVLAEVGPDHAKNFEIGVFLNSKLIAKGQGSSKQEAQVSAADNALKEKDKIKI